MKDTTPKEKYRRCCGRDVHKETVVVCVLPPDGEAGQPLKKVYGRFRNDVGRMRGWLKQLKVTEIAMESTGVYWRPLWNVWEGHGFPLVLANPKQVKALHGRKSDKGDSQRIAEFLQDRRIDPSFVPPPEVRRLRDLRRYRVSLLEQQNETHNKIRDLFETANIKLSSVASDLLGVSGQNIIEALIAGETSPDRLSWNVKGRLRKILPAIWLQLRPPRRIVRTSVRRNITCGRPMTLPCALGALLASADCL